MKLTVVHVAQLARDAGAFLWVQRPSYARHHSRYTLYDAKSDMRQYVGSSDTLVGIVHKLEVWKRNASRAGNI